MNNMSEKKRVLIISPSNTGTIPRRSLGLYEAMSAREDVIVKLVHIHHYDNGFPEYEQSEWHEGKTTFLQSVFGGISRVKWLKKIKKEFRPQLTISMLSGCSTTSVMSGGDDLKIGIFRAPISQIKGLWLQYFIAKLSYRFIYPRLDHLFCISKEIEEYIKTEFPWIPSSKLEVVYNVFDFEKINKLSIIDLPEGEFNMFFDGKVILSVGRVESIKAPERLVKAFIKSGLANNGYRLVFVGEDVNETVAKLINLVKGRVEEDKIHFLGNKKNPYQYMAHSTAIVSSSKSEGLPGVLIESLIVGKPIVTTNSSRGVWEILSCDEQYDANLQNIVQVSDGIITPNTSDEQLNIEQLAIALNEIVGEQYKEVKAPFLQKVTSEYIVDKYLNCIK